jgi:hypothetical protein
MPCIKLLVREVERKRRPRHERVHRFEQALALVAHDEHGFLALAGTQVVVIDQSDVRTVRGDDATVEGEVLRLGDGIQLTQVEQLVRSAARIRSARCS